MPNAYTWFPTSVFNKHRHEEKLSWAPPNMPFMCLARFALRGQPQRCNYEQDTQAYGAKAHFHQQAGPGGEMDLPLRLQADRHSPLVDIVGHGGWVVPPLEEGIKWHEERKRAYRNQGAKPSKYEGVPRQQVQNAMPMRFD
ncbi:hypothetical protein B0I37DRAFT_447325, partial [Chaetomium sp. MPI-CAGE-AT-0009]